MMKAFQVLLCSVPIITQARADSANVVTMIGSSAVPRVHSTIPDIDDAMLDSTNESCVANNQSNSRDQGQYDRQQFQRQPVVGLSKPMFTYEHHEQFERDGFLVVSGLLDDQLEEFVNAGDEYASNAKKSAAYFSIIDMGLVFDAGKSEDTHITKAFRNVAFESKLPQAVAELMRLPPTQNVRLLR